jgi:hypothetical protein
LSTTNPLDQTAKGQGSGTAVSTGATPSTSSANELVFAAAGFVNNYSGAVTAGPTYALQLQDVGMSRSATETAFTSSQGSVTGSFTLSASTNWSAVVATFSTTAITGSPPAITTTSLPSGTQNIAYNATLAASGGTTPYTWSITVGSLPAGLTLTSSTGVISGTPTGTGTSNFTIQVTDARSQVATKALGITIATSGGGGIALLQTNAAQGAGVKSLSVSFASANAPGNLIIAFVRMSTASQTVTVSDTAGNTYADAVAQPQTTDGHQIHIFYAKNIRSGANTVTASYSGTNNHPWLAIYEYSGLSTTNPLDQTAKGQGSGTAVSTGATPSTSSANELVFAAAGFVNNYSGIVTAGAGYSLQQQNTAKSRAANEVQLAVSAGSFTGTFSLSSSTNWSAVLATFH